MPDNLELFGIFLAGLLTFVTPCVLPMIPIYLALLVGSEPDPAATSWRRRTAHLLPTALFSLGLLTIFILLGLTATALGALLIEHRGKLTLLGGLVIFLFGLKFVGWLNIAWLDREKRMNNQQVQTKSRLLNALLMGLVFSLGWTPCIGPILGSVLTYTASKTADLWRGAAYLAAYGLGFVAPLFLVALFADLARPLVSRLSPWLPRVERFSGLLLMAVGLWLMLGASMPQTDSTPAAPISKHGVVISPPLGQPSARPRMVQFTSADCPICRQMIPTVAVIERDCDGQQVDVIKVDVRAEANRRLAQSYRVRGVPTFVFLDAKGRDVARLVGHQTLDALRQALSAMVGERCVGVGLLPTLDCEKSGSGQCNGGLQ